MRGRYRWTRGSSSTTTRPIPICAGFSPNSRYGHNRPSGVSGLTAAYLLQRRFDVTLFEAAPRLGGHADTHDVVTPDAGTVPVDTGFIVYNDTTYPHLRRLLAELEVRTQPTTMSMSIHCEGCGLEYAGGRGVGGVLAQPRSAVTPAFVRMLVEVKRFHRQAKAMVADGDDHLTLREFLTARRVLALLRPPLCRPGRVLRVVCRHRRGVGVPRSVSLRIPRQPWHAVDHRIAGVADNQWRFTLVRRPDRQDAACGAHRDSRTLRRAIGGPGRKFAMSATRWPRSIAW